MIVVDASVAVQWAVPEQGYEGSASLLGRDDLIAPTLLSLEVSNALSRKLRSGQIERAQAMLALREIGRTVTLTETTPAELERAFDLSVLLNHPIYDCVYLALAEVQAATFATRDAELMRRASQAGLSVVFHPLPEAGHV